MDTKVIVTVEHRVKGDGDKLETEIQTLQLAKVEGSWATYEGVLTQTRPGEYRFWLTQPDVAKQQPNGKKPSATAVVVRPPGEDQLRFGEREMIQAAAASRSKEELAAAVAAIMRALRQVGEDHAGRLFAIETAIAYGL